jgi:type IV pilus modification protein PilV
MKARPMQNAAGFSLIEVLIAVAVLSFGLLALASLQASLVRSSAETKARSVGVSLAKDELERIRSFDATTDYLALADATSTVPDASGSLGFNTYTVTRTIERFAYNPDPDNNATTNDGRFEAVTADTGALPSTMANQNEFKKITIAVGWTGADGVSQVTTLEDAIGAVSPENTGRLARRKAPRPNRKPEVRIQDPSADPGVIPIAIGNGSETAATNPKPDVATGVALQTTFDIFTYSAISNTGLATAQSRVETAVIGCRCTTAGVDSGTIDFRPSVWNGERYILPKEATGYAPKGREADLRNNDPDQSILCTACCRDHHDPLNVAAPKFSPRRATHNHYLNPDLTTVVTTGEYSEACRMIRVDGIFRVAADPYNEYTNILKTKIGSGQTEPFTDPAPDETQAEPAYVSFVIDYLKTQGRQSNPNAQLTQAVADAKAEASLLNPADQNVSVGDTRWMHARGLYVDWMEEKARDAILKSQQTENCRTPLTLDQCLLRVLPFTSINVTELAAWTPAVAESEAIDVANNDFTGSTLANSGAQNPIRGRVSVVEDGSAPATAAIRTSNTGLLANTAYRIDLADETAQTNNLGDQPDDDGQIFTVVAPRCGGSGTLTLVPQTGSGANAVPPVPGVLQSASDPLCNGDGTVGTTARRIVLTVNAGTDGPERGAMVLRGPDGAIYYSSNSQPWSALSGTFEFDVPANSNPDMTGRWSLSFTNLDTGGQANTESVEVRFSVRFLYTADFRVTLAGYTFIASTQPSGTLSTGGTCAFSNSVNPTTCNTLQPGVSTVWTMGSYNHSYLGTSQSATCTAEVRSGQTTSIVSEVCSTTVHCKNYSVDTVTLGGSNTGITIGTPANPGGKSESTPITFGAGFVSGDQVLVSMSASGAEVVPSCALVKSGNNYSCPVSQSSTSDFICP